MATSGDGSSFGEALINAIAAAADGVIGVRKSYDAKGWHAQFSHMSKSGKGYQAMEAAGLSATARTQKAWLSQEVEPNPANRAKIAEAYQRMAGRWPAAAVEGKDVRIRGDVQMGEDRRNRGGGDSAPLLVDSSGGNWSRMRDAWNRGEVDADEFEEYFILDVLEADLGEGSEEWEFPGGTYSVTIG
ncbi:hypothetical protein [Streptomyces sp. NPDC056264]|uniref:hypothetical protein n=1 Tax=Streptomyces sp. NPDC056264 TaxID=3345767 RepID=UPI003AAC1B05